MIIVRRSNFFRLSVAASPRCERVDSATIAGNFRETVDAVGSERIETT